MNLVPVLKTGGEWLAAGEAAKRGLFVSETVAGGVRRVVLENRSGATVRPDELGWRKEGRDDFDVPGEEMAFSIRLEGVKGGIPSGEHFIDWEPRVFFMGGAAVAPETLRPGTEPADYDAVFAAKRVKCPAEISSAGLGDYVSPPSSLAVLYNALSVPKKITWRQGWTHGWNPDGMAEWTVDGGFDETDGRHESFQSLR